MKVARTEEHVTTEQEGGGWGCVYCPDLYLVSWGFSSGRILRPSIPRPGQNPRPSVLSTLNKKEVDEGMA